MVSEGAGAAAECVSSPQEVDHGSYSTYTVVVSEGVETCWQHEGVPAVTVADPMTLKGAP